MTTQTGPIVPLMKGILMEIGELPEMLTVAEAAEYLRVPKSWIYERTRNRSLPIRKLGNHIRIPRSEFLAWVDRDGKVMVDISAMGAPG